ncbi:Malate permease [Alkalibacterium sp. AK22]|uniref:AEC family transporter n=1 Tax=Alkalibacterium sp. AK22 TaxID=1229520 RepID=UPI000447D53F|nr:AEC family transporter [Alkalibacterium sp. AK22]EXJ23535.1 Malate permease [Alkalibacterium sp. AK22]
MDISLVIFEQLLQMFLIMMFGFALVKIKFLNMDGSQQLANIVTKILIPIVLVLSFQQDFEADHLQLLFTALIGSLAITLSRILIAHTLLKNRSKIDRYAIVFSNTAFMGIPIVLPILGYEGIFFLSMYIVTSAVFQFTYGIWILSEGRQPITLKSIFTNPASIGAFIGFGLYLTRLPLPPVLYDSLDSIGGLSSPLGMILLGGYLARTQLKEIFLVRSNYWTVAVRLIIAPAVALLLIWLLPISHPSVLLVLAIANCTPTAVNTALFSQIYGGDYEYGARIIILASFFSIVTMPLMISFATLFLF